MLRLAPTLSAVALLAVVLAAAAPLGAGMLLKAIFAKDHVAISLNDTRLKKPVAVAASIAKVIAAKGLRTL